MSHYAFHAVFLSSFLSPYSPIWVFHSVSSIGHSHLKVVADVAASLQDCARIQVPYVLMASHIPWTGGVCYTFYGKPEVPGS